MKAVLRFTFFILIFVFYGLYLANVNLQVVPELKPTVTPEYFDYRGAINVRSSLSDGAREPLRIIQAAQQADLDFLFITDLYRKDQNLRYQGYFDRLLVMSGQEYRILDSRILAIGGPKLTSEDLSWRMADWLSQSHYDDNTPFIVLATPFNSDGQAQWGTQWPVGVHAIEVQNPKMISARMYRASILEVLWSFLVYPFNAEYAFLRLYKEPTQELELWDKLGENRPLVGVSGLDANARAIAFPGNYWEFPSYRESFKMMSTHVLLENELSGTYERDQKILLKALKQGQVYFSLDMLGNPKGFMAYVLDGKKRILMGQKKNFQPAQKLVYQLPSQPREFFEVLLMKNGVTQAISNKSQDQFYLSGPGHYRLVVRVSPFFPLPDAKKWVTWIYTNPFYLVP